MLSDREFFISCDPHLVKFEPIPNPPPCSVPDREEGVKTQLRSTSSSSSSTSGGSEGAGAEVEVASYRVTDLVHAIPAGVWDTNVVSTFEFVDVAAGVFVRIRSPLSVVMETCWEVREGEGGAGLELVEDVTIRCSRLLVGLVKGQCEEGWGKIHGKMIGRLEGEVKGEVKGGS
jgi:hypothetical protein